MCGIYGCYGFLVDKNTWKPRKILHQRGPDGAGIHIDDQSGITLGHNRLSIIDLTDTGQQPMCNEDGTVWITFNGEIYNYRALRSELIDKGHVFMSETDTEVIIHAYESWGDSCLQKFNGMFAFCIWDKKKKRMFLARDRLGIKPLYYSDNSGKFIFGSEPKAILAHPGFQRDIAAPGLISYLIYRYIAGGQSIWKGIKKLAPGHSLVYDLETKKIRVDQYWSIPVHQKKWNEEDALERFEELLASSVAFRLIADVPVGVFLSGGMDSTAISAVASGLSPQISTFSIGFSGSSRSELADAQVVAEYLKTDHHQQEVGVENIEDLKAIFSYIDEPLGDSSIIPTYLLCREGRKHAKVILAGDGGDELLGGYNWYTRFKRMMMLKPIAMLMSPILGLLGEPGRTLSHSRDEFELYRQLTSPRFLLSEITGLFPWIKNEDLPASENYLLKQHHRVDLAPCKRWQYVDALSFMTDDVLTKVDRASMANSLEVRVPFLDHRMVEFAFSLPDNLCIKQSEKKYLLKQFLKHRVPPSTFNKPKQGFSCPVSYYWPVEKMIRDVNHGSLLKNGVMAGASWKQLCDQKKMPNWGAKVWLIAVLEKWAEFWL